MRCNIKSSQSETGSSRSKSGFNVSEVSGAHSQRSATPDTRAEHRVLRSMKRTCTDQISSRHKRPRENDRQGHRSTHQECFKHLSTAQEELHKAWNDQDQERADSTQIIQRLQMEKSEVMERLRKALAENEKLSCEAKKLQMEVGQWQQQVESFNSTLQGQVAWDDIQPAMYQAHGDLVSAATRFWRSVEAIQNRQLATYLPGSGVLHGPWSGQVSAQEPLIPTSLPDITALGEYPGLPHIATTTE